jgi:hypothetical protein
MDVTDIERLKEIEQRLSAQGGIDWAPLSGDGNRLARIPVKPTRPQRDFIASAPRDIMFLLDLVERLAGGGDETVADSVGAGADVVGSDGGAAEGDTGHPDTAAKPVARGGARKRG